MKKFFLPLIVSLSLFISWCYANIPEENKPFIHFAVSAEYPPFEYNERGVIKGFDIDLARMIAKKLGKTAVFDSMQFSNIFPALSTGNVDAAISTLTITEPRQKNFDFSKPYYYEGLATVFAENNPVKNTEQLHDKKIAVQLGSTMELWLKKSFPSAQILVVDNNNQCIAALKAGHVDLALMDGAQGKVFSEKNPGLGFAIVSQSKDGYGIALKRGSPLTQEINFALAALEQSGELKALKEKWFGEALCKN